MLSRKAIRSRAKTRRFSLSSRKKSNSWLSGNRRGFVETLEQRTLLSVGTWQPLAASGTGPAGGYGQALALLGDGSVMVQAGQNQSSNTWFDLAPTATGNTFPGTGTNTGNYVNGAWTSLASSGTWLTPPEQRLFDTTAVLPDGRVFTIGGEYTTPHPFTGTSEIFNPVTNTWTQTATIPTLATGIRFNSTKLTGASNTSPITITAVDTTGLTNGERVTISGVLGNTAANGTWTIGGLTATTFTLTGSTGNGAYTSGGKFGVSQFGDDPIEVLPNGTVLAGWFNGPQTYIYNPTTDSWAATGSKLRGDASDEETWLKLPDGSILSYDVFGSINAGVFKAQRYIPASGTWMDASNLDGGNPPSLLSDGPPAASPALPSPNDLQGDELGPAFLLPNGNAMFFGGNGHTAIYNPTTNLWSAGPDMPTKPVSNGISGATNVSGTITGASNASPIVITAPSTAGLSNGDLVTVSGVTGNTAANGNWVIQGLTATSFQLQNSTGNGAYVSGGTWFDAIKITTPSTTGLSNGQLVTIASVGGNTAANGSWTITNLTGTSFQLVGPKGNAAYTSGGTWSSSQLSMDDAPGCMMANGHILLAVSPLGGLGANNGYTFPNPCYTYDFDPTTGIYTEVTPAGGISVNSDFLFMIALPSGQVLMDNQLGPEGFQIYSPAGLPSDSWRPVITGISNDGGGNYTLHGTQLNGISEGGSFGDEATMATNYPIIQFTDFGGNVLYGTTSGWSSTGVDTGTSPESVHFTLPAGHTNISDFASIIVTANGIPSLPASLFAMGPNEENLYVRVDPNDSTTVEVWADGGFEVGTFPNNSATPVAFVGDANNNQLVIDNSYGVVNTPINFDGGTSPGAPGDRMLVVGTTGNDTFTLTPTSTTTANMSIDGSALYSFTNIQQFSFFGAAGNDQMDVDTSTSLLTVPIFYDGDNGYNFVAGGFGDPPSQGNGFNTLVITQTGGATQTSDTYSVGPNVGQGSDVIVGAAGTQTIQFQNLAPVQDNVPSLTQTVNATPADNAINYTQGPGGGIFGAATTGLITIDNQESYEFANKGGLTINSLAGADTINLNDPTTPTGLTAIAINGGGPAPLSTLLVNGTTGKDTINYTVAGPTSSSITGAGPVGITTSNVEQVVLDGQGGGDNLTVTTVPGSDQVTLTSGAAIDAGSVSITSTISPVSDIPLSFSGLGAGGSVNFADGSGTRQDTLVDNGTAANDTFSVAANTGAITLNSQLPVTTPGIFNLVLNGLAGDDLFTLGGTLPYTTTTVSGGDPSASDTLNLTGATGAVAVSLGDSTIPTNTTITGFGGTVTLTGVEVANIAAGGNTVTVTGTTGADSIGVTPSGAASATVQPYQGGTAQNAQGGTLASQVAISPTLNFTGVSTAATGLTINGNGGSNQLFVVATQNADTIDVDDAASGANAVKVNSLLVVNFNSALAHVEIDALAGSDTINIQPSTTTTFLVDGGDPIGVLPGDTINLIHPAAQLYTIYPGPTTDSGGLNTAGGFQTVSWVHIETVTNTGGGPPLILGTNGNDEITVIARDNSYNPANPGTPNPLLDGVQDFTVSVNNGPDMLFINTPNLFIDALSGNDDIVVREPAPNQAVWNVQLFVAGGPPAAGVGRLTDNVELESTGSQSVTYNPNNPLASVPAVGGVTFSLPATGGGQLSDPSNTSTINAVQFLIPAFYQSSPGGVEDFIYSGDPNNLTYNTPSGGANSVVFTPGTVADSGTVTGNAFSGAALTPLAFTNLAGGTVTFTTSNAGRADTLQVNGTVSGETFNVVGGGDAGAGTVQIMTSAAKPATPLLQTPAIGTLLLDGNGGVDTVNLSGTLPYTGGVVVNADSTVNLTAAVGPVNIALGDNTPGSLNPNTVITGYGAPVTLIGVDTANLDATGQTVSAVGTSQNDSVVFTPTGATAGTFHNNIASGDNLVPNTVFNLANVAGNFTVFGGSGGNADEVVVQGTAARDLFEINQGTAVATVLANNVNAWLPVQLGTNVPVLTALGLGGEDTFQVIPAIGIGAFPLDNMLINIDGGDPQSSDALVVASSFGTAPAVLPATEFAVLDRGRTANSGTVRVFSSGSVQFPDINYKNVETVDVNATGAGTLNPNLLVMGPDLFEPNDAQGNAAFIGSGSTLQIQNASIFPNSNENPGVPADQDYYRVVAQYTGTLDFQVYFKLYPGLLPQGGNLALQVLDVAGNVIANTISPAVFGAAGSTANARVRIPAVAGQSYYLRVFGGPNADGLPNPLVVNGYNVTVINTPPPVANDVELARGVLAVTLTSGGTGYTSAPIVTFSGGGATTQATAIAVIQGGSVTAIKLLTNGSGYTSAPTITFTGGGFTTIATATASLVDEGDLPTNAPNDDSGRTQFDNVTFDNTPTIYFRLNDGILLNDLPGNGTTDTPPAGVIPIPFTPSTTTAGYRLAVFDGNNTQTPVGFATQVAGFPGLYQFTFTTALADGVHHISAEVQMVDPALPTHQTGFGDRSVSLDITVDTVAPPNFFGLVSQADTTEGLDQASDSGVLGDPNLPATFTDRATNVKTPTLYGAAEANAIVRLYLDTNGVPGLQTTGANPDTFLGESVAVPLDGTNQFPNGEWTFHVTRDLNDPTLGLGHDGLRTFFVTGEDLAGNLTADANADSFQIFIDTQGPQVTNVQITGSPNYNLFGLKAETITDTVDEGFSTTSFSGNTNVVSPAGETLSSLDGVYDGRQITFTSGVDAGQTVTVTGYVGSTHTFTVSPALANAPNGDDSFQILGNSAQGPTPLVNSLTISVQDLPPRVVGFLYNVLAADAITGSPATDPGNYLLVGDAGGVIPIQSVQFNPNPVVAGSPATGTLVLTFANPLPDDRYTLTIKDNVVDPVGNKLDGESNAIEPNGAPNFPSGDGQPGGNFVARFTVDSRPEIGTWSAGSVYVDINGNFVFDPTNADAVNRDMIYSYAYTSDNVFAGNFSPIGATTADGFDKLGTYGLIGKQYRWAIDTNNDGVPDLIVNDPANINGEPVAGNFDGNAANGDEVGLFTGTQWYLDTNHDYKVDTVINSPLRGYPIVGDFDGDGVVDLATYQPNPVNKFFFDFGGNGYGQIDATIDAASAFGFIGVRTLPVAADMDADGTTDVGLWVPDRAGASNDQLGEWYFLTSNFATPTTGTVDTLNHQFSPTPVGHDIYARFGNQYAMPIVGNFDPPVAAATGGPTIGQVAVAQAKGRISWNVVDPDGVASSTLAIDGALVSGVAGPFAAASGVNYSAPLGTLAVGQHIYTITATDKAGHISTSSDTFVVAAQGPTIGQVAVSQAKGRISWNATDPDGVRSSTISIDGKLVSGVAGPFAAASGVNLSAPLGKLIAGDHSYTITATDKTGHSSTLKGTFPITAVTNNGPTIGQVVVSLAKGRISWNATDADGVASSSLLIDGKAVSKVAGPFTAGSGVNFSAPLGSLAAGDHTYAITATDRAGNATTLRGSFKLNAAIAAARSALFSQPGVAAASSSAKVAWLFDLAALSNHSQSDSENAVDAVLATY